MNAMITNPEQNSNVTGCAPQILSFEDERKLVMASDNYPFGIIIRLPLFTGITLSEVLALQWKHVDPISSLLHIVNEMDFSGSEPVLRPSAARRTIPLPAHVLEDLLAWKRFHYHMFNHCAGQTFFDQPVAKAAFGDVLNAETIEAGCYELCVRAGITPVPYNDLRHTFVVRALEQGMDKNVLNCILGIRNAAESYLLHYNYARAGYRNLLDNLLTVQNCSYNQLAYPVVITPLEDGKFKVYAPDFPGVECVAEKLIAGLIQVQNSITEKCFCATYPVAPTSPINLDVHVPFGSFSVLMPLSV